jgi:hypothetical protein
VFTSASRVEFAHDCGLTTSEAYHRAARKHGDIATLVAAHALGMQYTVPTMAAVTSLQKYSICLVKAVLGLRGWSMMQLVPGTSSWCGGATNRSALCGK